jgi:hypothetical protein
VKPVHFSRHARQQMVERGASQAEVLAAIRSGRREPAKRGRDGYRRSFPYNRTWSGRTYATKQVLAIVSELPDRLVVVTVYTFYF